MTLKLIGGAFCRGAVCLSGPGVKQWGFCDIGTVLIGRLRFGLVAVLALGGADPGCAVEKEMAGSALPQVTLPQGAGTLVGRASVVRPAAGRDDGAPVTVKAFKGIPYAHPPVGERRWRAPIPLERLPRDPFQAWAYGPAAPHQPTTGERIALSAKTAKSEPGPGASAPAAESEDCLFLNVWTPAGAPTDRLPVLVWIHGGGFVRGTASTPGTDGTRLAARGVVVVTLNYRTGPLGFFHHEAFANEADSKVNFGLLDQILALRWIKANIQAFGGDPSRVTIFGSSAGGASVLALMLAPAVGAEALFQRAVVQSGGGIGSRPPATSARTSGTVSAESMGGRFYLGLDKTSPGANPTGRPELGGLTLGEMEKRFGVATALRHGVTFEQLMDFYGTKWDEHNNVVKSEFRNYPFVDGAVVPHDSALQGFTAKAQMDIPLIIGYASYEASVVFGLGQTPDREWGERLVQQFKIAPRFSFGDLQRLYGTTDDAKLATFLYRDVIYGLPAQLLAGSHAANKKNPVWVYRFGYASGRSKVLAPDQAGHSADVAYLFGTFPRPVDGRPAKSVPGLENDLAVSDLMATYWINLAANGDPSRPYHWPARSTEPKSPPAWGRYEPARENILLIDNGGIKGGIRVHEQERLNQDRRPLLQHLQGVFSGDDPAR